MMLAFLAIGVMAFVLFNYNKHDAPPTTKAESGQPHAGTQHHTAEAKHMGGEPAPLQAYAKAQVGDWIAYRVSTTSSLLPNGVSGLVLGRVTAATDGDVTIDYKARGEKNIDRREAWSETHKRQNLTIDELTDNTNEWKLFDLQVNDDTHDVGGRAFKCKKLTYAKLDPMLPNTSVRDTAWYSEEVPLGLVQDTDVQDMPNFHSEQTKQLIGFGTASATTWGTKPDGL